MNIFARDDSLLIHNDVILANAPSPEPSQTFRGGTRMTGTIFLMVNATLGAGILNFPQAFDKAGGIASATIIQLGLLVFITAALIILAHCSDVTNTSNMQDTLAGLCGKKALFICGICVAVYSFGCSLTFVIIIGDQFDRVLATYYGMDYCNTWYLSRAFVTSITCCVFILPLCFFKKLDVLSYASSVGCITIVYLIWIVFKESPINHDDTTKPTQMWPDNFVQALRILPIICFSYQSHMTAIPTYACMRERKVGNFAICCVISMLICFLAYAIVGIFGYTTFGTGNVPDDILQGYTETSVALTAAIIAVALKCFMTYPIILFCGRNAFLGLLDIDTESNNILKIVVTFLWFGLSLLIAIVIPDIGPIINIMGTLSAAFIFIFPGICLLRSTILKDPALHLNKDRFLVLAAVLIIALGAFICGLVFVQSLQDIIDEKSPEPPLITGFKANLGRSLCP